ncbi:dienelactone hydrolase family protein [Synechococcus sp. MW101C3]|uniref:dienelactone hydrolase family protein n=1 Tax=Synechococcus sp. MW101C3 TaxID=210768 RepID=UPI001E46A841|nr:dienelactone hydrolase family protein [Synechococcus sp. MW101C3]
MAEWITLPAAPAAAPGLVAADRPAGSLAGEQAQRTGVVSVPLRCWWAAPAQPARGAILVLPEVFGINAWVRSVADRLALEGYAALAVPLFARSAPALELGYSADDLAEGRSHKDRTSSAELLADLDVACQWLQERTGAGLLGCVGFCFGGHAALLAASLPQIAATADFYGAGVASGRPGGGPPTLEVLPEVTGRVWCFCGRRDPLMPAAELAAIGAALRQADPAGGRHRLIELEAGHGFMCEARPDHDPVAAAAGWRGMLELFATTL